MSVDGVVTSRERFLAIMGSDPSDRTLLWEFGSLLSKIT